MSRIYSCTMFYNEFRLLDLKVEEELAGGVCHFLVSEAGETFSGKPKERLLKDSNFDHPNVERVDVEDFSAAIHEKPSIRAFQREAIQRNAPIFFLREEMGLKDDDVVICTDIDEVFPASDIQIIAAAAREHGIVHCLIKQFLYKINLHHRQPYYGAFAALGGFFNNGLTINRLRTQQAKIIRTNGKHFEYLGLGPAGVAQKMGDFAHISYDKPEFTDEAVLRKAIEEHRDPYRRGVVHTPVRIDDTYPWAIRGNLRDWEAYIEEGATARLSDFPEVPVEQFQSPNSLDQAVYEAVNSVEAS